jgi:hypothetical protein
MTLGKSLDGLAVKLKAIARSSAARAFAAALLISPIPFVATTTEAPAQAGFAVDFGSFYDELAPYGTWHHHARWGDVWRPRRVEADFRPYHRGHWENTREYGFLWVSDHIWGDIPFHYGRWVYDPFDGWLWLPGYVWAPSWVVWRSGGGYTGWFPMPPDDGFLYGGRDPLFNRWDNWDRGYGYADWYGPSFGLNTLLDFWIFVEDRRFADRDYIRYIPPRNTFITIVNNTTNVTNYVTVNNYIINRSVDVRRVERAAGRPIAVVDARAVLRRNITTVDQGNRAQQNERRQHGGNRNASANERIVALPESRARAISPPVGGGQDRDRIDRVIGSRGGGDNEKGNGAVPRDRPGLGNNNGPDLQRERANERRGNGPGQNGLGQNEAVTRQQDRPPRVEPPRAQARQQGPQNEAAPQSGGDNKRIDRNQPPDREQKGAARDGAARRGNQNR